jgi:hypothetical protein
MLDHSKGQAALGRRETVRLMFLVGLALAVAGAMLTRSLSEPTQELQQPALVPAGKDDEVARVTIDRARVSAVGDGPAAHQDDAYERGALDYVLSVAGASLADVPEHVTTERLSKVPFAEAAGRPYEVRGTVLEVVAREHRGSGQRLWTLVVQGEDGAQVLVLKQGFASDPAEGRPRSATDDAAPIEKGDQVVVRGIYLQRRSGTIGSVALREPVPVLVLVKMRTGVAQPAAAIADPSRADWDEVEDRFMAETVRWEEPALFQTVQWARERGPQKVREDVLSGKFPWKDWDAASFRTWEKDVHVKSDAQVRPFVDAARGTMGRFTGVVGRVVYEGWEAIPSNPQGVDHLYVYDLVADDFSYGGLPIPLRCFSPFPPDAFPGITGRMMQPIRAYGFFFKNYTYDRKQAPLQVTVPSFVLLHLEPYEPARDRTSVWIIAGSMVVLGALFYFTLIRGERKESKRMEVYRRDLRQRMRKVGQGPMAGAWPPSNAAESGATSPSPPPEEREPR